MFNIFQVMQQQQQLAAFTEQNRQQQESFAAQLEQQRQQVAATTAQRQQELAAERAALAAEAAAVQTAPYSATVSADPTVTVEATSQGAGNTLTTDGATPRRRRNTSLRITPGAIEASAGAGLNLGL